ncbi:hypothetical protein AZ66_23625 [Paenibacillus sp. E194]|nr:hypothetical protein AZ66_23625 [Paenibacillus sp. E194]
MRPRMQHYIDVSLMITQIYEEFTDLVEVFSNDEQFLDVAASQSIFGDPITIAMEIQKRVMIQTGVRIRIGISTNKILAKTETDIWKKVKAVFLPCIHPMFPPYCGKNLFIKCSVLDPECASILRN